MPKVFSESEPRRAPLNLKTTKGLRDRIEQSAKASGRALTHEIEHRIEQSFGLDREIGGREAHEILHNLSKYFRLFNVGAFSNQRDLARAAIKAAFSDIVDNALPDPSGLASDLWASSPEAPEALASAERLSRELAAAVIKSSALDQLAVHVEAKGADAQRYGEGVAYWAGRVLLPAMPPAKPLKDYDMS